MTSRGFVYHAHTRADRDTAADLLEDVDSWFMWSRPLLATTRWTRWGNSIAAGAGAVRQLEQWPIFIRELITAYQRGDYQEYTVVSPQLFTTYTGRISLSAGPGGGTLITWSVEFTPRLIAAGPAAAFALSRAIKRLSRNLARAADAKSLSQAVS